MRMDGWMDGKETKTMDISQNIQERQHKTNVVTIKCHGSFGLLMVALNIGTIGHHASLETSTIMNWMHKSEFIFDF